MVPMPRLQGDFLQAAGDLLRRDQLAAAGAGADLARLLPRLGRADVALPERPCAALPRPHRVNGTAGGAVVKHAVAVELLAQGAAAVRQPRVQAAHLRHLLAAKRGDGGQLLLVHPDEPGGAGAAMAAAGTAKS